jgi:hypothetical protein
MTMLKGWACGDRAQGTLGTYTNELPNTEPTGASYVKEKASQYSATKRQNLGGTDSNNRANWNPWNFLKQWKLRKTLKREGKYNATNMAA